MSNICYIYSTLFLKRLQPVENLEHQRLEGDTLFSGSGLFFKPVLHEGNSNLAIEEIQEIVKIVNDLTKGDVYFYDNQNVKHQVKKEHIKIITPYNCNVFEMQKRIQNVAIGTVDKFQGQEAPIVIYSLCSSSPEDAPRGMDFLYSPNRFNVAVSRAKAIFIMVGSPNIFEPDCKSPEQIKLANPFCRFMEITK